MWAQAQWNETLIVGDVRSEATGEPISNANIYFRNTGVGTTSNEEGSFALRCVLDKKRTLVVSSVGYVTQRYSIEPGQMAGIEILLKERQALLPEILALPGENPALPLIQAVRQHRQENDRYLQTDHGQQLTATTDLYISHIGRRQLRHQVWQQLRSGMLTNEDSTLLLPLYTRTEQVAIDANRTQVVSTDREQALILTPTDYSALLHTDGNISFYGNNISLMGHTFLSPLAASGTIHYNYYLADSLQEADGKTYCVHFRPKNNFYATLSGEMWIDSATYALRSVRAQASPQVGINYLGDASICQRFAADNSLMEEDISALLDFAVTTDTTRRILPTALIRYHMASPKAEMAGVRPQPIDSLPLSPIDTLRQAPVIRVATWLAQILTTGYIPTGTVFDFGHVQEILQVNDHEKLHIGLPMRTNEKLLRNVCFEANVAYGVSDRAWKGMGRVSFNLPTPRRNILHVEYRDHYVWSEVDDFTRLHHENSMGYGLMDFTAYAFEALHSNNNTQNTAARRRQFEVRTENDWHKWVETTLYARIGWQNYGDPLVGYAKLPYFSYQCIGGIVRLGFGERKTDLWFKRVHSRSRYPVVYAGVEGGSFSTPETSSYRLYSRLNLMVQQTLDFGIGGELTYSAHIGGVIGKVPYPLLHQFEGNQGYAYDPYRFTLMNNFQYAADCFLALHTAWNGKGILFNLIPGVRYMRLRELVTLKMAWGGDLRVPYVEVGCGIGNILRVAELHSVWRLTHRSDLSTPLWAIRFRIHIGY